MDYNLETWDICLIGKKKKKSNVIYVRELELKFRNKIEVDWVVGKLLNCKIY